ncbi:unnamed protein product, partial [Didymodactylos carnosus]
INIGDKSICSKCYAIADTGTTFIVGPSIEIRKINKFIGSEYDYRRGLYTIQCNYSTHLLPVQFQINERIFQLQPNQYLIPLKNNVNVCVSVFVSIFYDLTDSHRNSLWILGDAFLTRYYSIFDLEHKRLGFAKSIAYDQKQMCFDSLYNDDSTTTITTEDDSYPLDDEYANDGRSTTEMYSDVYEDDYN